MKRFLIQLTLLSIVTGLFIEAWNTYAPEDKHLNALWLILLFFFLITALIHYMLIHSETGKPSRFIRNFMGTTTAKFLIYLAFLLIYCLLYKYRIRVFLAGFMIHYLFFTVFEVYSVLSFLKKK